MLFTGTLRFNLDPVGQHSDKELWKVLELSHLKHICKNLENGLENHVSEGLGFISIIQDSSVLIKSHCDFFEDREPVC